MTSSLGKDTYAAAAPIQTTPASYPFCPFPTVVDANTLAVLRASSKGDGLVLRDPHRGNAPVAGVNTTIAGAPSLGATNLLWMENRSGFALTFNNANDSLSFQLPPAPFAQLAANGTLSVALKAFIHGSGQGAGLPIGWGHRGNSFGRNIVAGVVQDWQHSFAWSAGEWDKPPAGQCPSNSYTTPLFFKNGAKSGFEMCFGPSTLGAGAKTRLESRIKKFTPHCVCRPVR